LRFLLLFLQVIMIATKVFALAFLAFSFGGKYRYIP
jgi:hypothetical protein